MLAWIGNIPKEWAIRKLKYLLKTPLKYGANEVAEYDDPNSPRYIRITDFSDYGRLRDETFKSLPYETAKDFLLEEGDVLFARSGATVGKTFQFRQYRGLACFAGYLIRATADESKMLADYLYFFTKSELYGNWKNSIFIQATIQNIGAEKYSQLCLTVPPIQFQSLIVKWLRNETSRIDALISKKARQIELLQEKRQAIITRAMTKGLDPNAKMKDSGVGWIGEIPEGWQTKRLKHLFRNMDFIRIPLSSEERADLEKTYPYYGASGIIDHVDKYLFGEDLILIAEDGANLLSRSTPLAFIARGKYWVNNHAHILKPLSGNLDFWESVLQSHDYTPLISGSAQPKLTAEALGEIWLPCPPSPEQSRLSDFARAVNDDTDRTSRKISESISLLQEYRSSLITAAVSGQIDVSKMMDKAPE